MAIILHARFTTSAAGDASPVIATMENGDTCFRLANDDNDGGGMLAYLAAGGVIEPYVEPLPTAETYAAAIDAHMDAVAKSRGYASGERMASYATDPAFSFEAQPFVVWRGQVWIYANTELAKVQAGQRAAPTVEGFISELPAIEWP